MNLSHQETNSRPLREVASIRAGYVPSASPKTPIDSGIRALQLSDLLPDGTVDWAGLTAVGRPTGWTRYLVRSGDVLIPMRSNRFGAVLLSDVPFDVVAVGHWAIISAEPKLLAPAFLSWYLNHPITKLEMAALAKGSKLQFMSMKGIKALGVPVPPLSLQLQIVSVHATNRRLGELEREALRARNQLVDAVTYSALRQFPSASRQSFNRLSGER